MYRYRRILVCLNLDEEDRTVIRYAGMVSRLARSEVVHFLHVLKPSELPKEILAKQPILQKPADSDARVLMNKRVSEYFDDGLGINTSCEVVAGASPVIEVLKAAVRQDVDLILVGTRTATEIPSGFAEKIARKAHCSVLVVPHGAEAMVSKIVVPTDFSEHSADAFDVATAFASASDLHDIYGLHVYSIPGECRITAELKKDVGDLLKEYAETAYGNFIAHRDLRGVSDIPVIREVDHPTEAIGEMVRDIQADLVVIGSRGRSAAAAVLLGSVAEGLIRATDVPLLAVKNKGDGMGVLEAIIERLK